MTYATKLHIVTGFRILTGGEYRRGREGFRSYRDSIGFFRRRHGTACNGRIHAEFGFVFSGTDLDQKRRPQYLTASLLPKLSLLQRRKSPHLTAEAQAFVGALSREN